VLRQGPTETFLRRSTVEQSLCARPHFGERALGRRTCIECRRRRQNYPNSGSVPMQSPRFSCAAVILLVASLCGVCHAQSRYRPPGGSPLPRQLDYFRRDVGVLDRYNTFVAPRRQLDRSLQQLQARQQQDMQGTQQSLSQIRQSTAAPTGTGATFMNYSHYYSNNGTTPVRASVGRTPPIRASYGNSFASNYASSDYGAGSVGVDSYGASSYGASNSASRSYTTPSYRANSFRAGSSRTSSYSP